MSENHRSAIAVIGIDIGKNSFHLVGLDSRGAIVLVRSDLAARSKHGWPIWRHA